MDDILAGLNILFNIQNLLLLVVGLVVGFIVGALPGFSSSNAVAVMLPLTITMEMSSALIFMASIYAGAQYAGAVPAILINTPGTAGAAATALDGYPMAQRGQAGLAIGIARMASAFGGVVSALIIMLIIGPFSKFALQFGAVEMFLIAVFGLTLISSVVETETRKGLISAALGLLIATMPADPIYATARFNLGFAELYESVPFIPILIGLFAITEMFLLAGQTTAAADANFSRENFKEIIHGIVLTLKYPIDLFRAALIGIIIGAIPGTGTSVSNFISYGISKGMAKDKETWGKGNPRGIIASEACDSAVTSGTMIPTLTLGIPGGTTTAIMLAAIYLHGVLPGPQVMSNYADMAYAILLTLGLSSFLILPLGIFLSHPIIRFSQLSPKIIIPIVTILCCIGAFVTLKSSFGIKIMFIFGLIGLLMKMTEYPVVPLVLALILGPIAEDNFVRAYMLSEGNLLYFFNSPIAIVLWVIILISLFSGPIKNKVWKRLA